MIGIRFNFTDTTKNVSEASEKAEFRNIGHAAAAIRKTMVSSIIKDEGPSAPGTPPHTRRRQLNRAIRFDNDRKAKRAIIGPRYSVVGTSASAHEFGGEYKGEFFDERPFAEPALRANEPRFAESFEGSIGQ